MSAQSKLSDPQVRSRLLTALECGLRRNAAIVLAGLSRASFYRELEKSEELREQVETAEARAELIALNGIMKHGRKDWTAFAWFLERTKHSSYGRANRDAITPDRLAATISAVANIVAEHVPSEQREQVLEKMNEIVRVSFAGEQTK